MFSQVPRKETTLLYGFWALVVGVFVYLGFSRPPAPDKITFERVGNPTQPEAPPKPSKIQVHVSGAVRVPGVYTLRPDSRVHDAIREAGGAKPNANLDEWNLAARVTDGSNLHINSKPSPKSAKPVVAARTKARRSTEIAPLRIDVPEAYRGGVNAFDSSGKIAVEPESKPVTASRGKKQAPAEGSISLNTANSEGLQRLPGVGPSTAEKILEYRREHGGFTSIEELLAVKGIGPKKLESMRKYLRL